MNKIEWLQTYPIMRKLYRVKDIQQLSWLQVCCELMFSPGPPFSKLPELQQSQCQKEPWVLDCPCA